MSSSSTDGASFSVGRPRFDSDSTTQFAVRRSNEPSSLADAAQSDAARVGPLFWVGLVLAFPFLFVSALGTVVRVALDDMWDGSLVR